MIAPEQQGNIMPSDAEAALAVKNGDRCVITAGTHKGKTGTVEDRKLSKSGHVTITVRLPDNDRIKTLARNVEVQ
jgi:ribosomal protein S4E